MVNKNLFYTSIYSAMLGSMHGSEYKCQAKGEKSHRLKQLVNCAGTDGYHSYHYLLLASSLPQGILTLVVVLYHAILLYSLLTPPLACTHVVLGPSNVYIITMRLFVLKKSSLAQHDRDRFNTSLFEVILGTMTHSPLMCHTDFSITQCSNQQIVLHT